jgi:hypothetical protein
MIIKEIGDDNQGVFSNKRNNFQNKSLKLTKKIPEVLALQNKVCLEARNKVLAETLSLHQNDPDLQKKAIRIFAYAGSKHIDDNTFLDKSNPDILILSPRSDDSLDPGLYADIKLDNKTICSPNSLGLPKAIEDLYKFGLGTIVQVKEEDAEDLFKKIIDIEKKILKKSYEDIDLVLSSDKAKGSEGEQFKLSKKELIKKHRSLEISKNLIINEFKKTLKESLEKMDKKQKKNFYKMQEGISNNLQEELELGQIDKETYFRLLILINQLGS